MCFVNVMFTKWIYSDCLQINQENRCIAMTGDTHKFENSGAGKVISKQRELDKYYKLFAHKDSIRKKI